jgi:protein-L-isoaspartate(D-aspartate) O-methyltransferase
VSALIDGGSFAYLTLRGNADRTVFEFGARGHGPEAAAAASRMAGEIRTWDRCHRGDRASFRADPAGTPDGHLPAGLTVTRRHYRITISWPAAQTK